ncbi:hypothetical protein [Bifidobacterium callitrichidarum]|uniref:Uncharacterized protein n=1 Tax=Bifidobacterium callitrichidarum TaxID=2052941 RepID=A0A2U2N9F9_9BIFI|nr:hypothetical protein [Bifidobacterium callitrichidarum]PWG65634.1 hypothetical protein DF196_06795 [Bifidobacterium callitrichidarum]
MKDWTLRSVMVGISILALTLLVGLFAFTEHYFQSDGTLDSPRTEDAITRYYRLDDGSRIKCLVVDADTTFQSISCDWNHVLKKVY